MKKALQITVSGKVQGVFFRISTKAVADQIGVKGFIKNQQDGSVYIEAEAEEELLNDFLEWCKSGPDEAEVSNISVNEMSLKNFLNFNILKK
jgi:acylphosphatase